MGKTRKRRQQKTFFTHKQYNHGNGMLTSIWGPPLWHVLHCISFNYPVNPTIQQKRQYRQFILSLQHVLPCIYCRQNFKKNIKKICLRQIDLKNRNNFSRWVYKLHNHVNKMLGKKSSSITYKRIRDRYEFFRSRCNNTRKNKKERGCTRSKYGNKSKCIMKIVPQKKKCKTFQIDKRCGR